MFNHCERNLSTRVADLDELLGAPRLGQGLKGIRHGFQFPEVDQIDDCVRGLGLHFIDHESSPPTMFLRFRLARRLRDANWTAASP